MRPTLHCLERGGVATEIEARSMDVLVDLARHAGALRSKRRLLHVVWGDAFVSDDVLTHAIWELRKALDDDPRDPRYIQTIPRKGYRLIAPVDPSIEVRPDAGAGAEVVPTDLLEPGLVLGGRYKIRSQLGRGGMGEVWRAFDLKLRVEVALKALRAELFRDDHRRDLLLREVRAAREVISPNVCRIFDLVEVEGRELVSMEYIDGQTLLELLQERGPLELKEAQEIASQFLAGLEAIHLAGLVHRDVKPENIMLTRAGRVVVMDFGLARRKDTGAGTVAGTPAYMAPELVARSKVDARADVYSAGVVLAEMVSPDGIQDFDSRQSIWEGVHSEPAQLPDSPWAPVIKRAVAKERGRRYRTAHTLIRALEDVTLRVEGAENLKPFPGLASFTEADADYFFGREAEVEQFWRKLEGPARLLAVVGPSGAGKTSFLRAGLIPSAPADWSVVRCVPGGKALAALRRVMTPALHDDIEALQAWMAEPEKADVAVAAMASWRRQHDRSLLIVDQFEELFTLNPAEEQARFADLLGRLPLEADVHVVLAMRDDFAVSCHAFESLRPVFHELTVLDTPSGANLRRALVRPAGKCGYRFEDDALVDEMLAEVEDERGALPTLAFAAACLWDERDRDRGLLTRRAYADIGGVGGALALHADTTLEKIGAERQPIVRELFRNLVTAQGTRAVREIDALLSVFPGDDREPVDRVLQQLIDARLLTCYEVHDEGAPATRRVEIIHESLLANWPRLVRWQTQDVDAAQLRDELRQAAHTWQEHERLDDLLWAGTAFREYQLWRERYPGGLTEEEETFAKAMTVLSTKTRRRRRLVASVVLLVLAIVAVTTTALWRRSALETRRAEAAKLLALGEVDLERHPTAALAWATASLELADTREGRMLALRALGQSPPVSVAPVDAMNGGGIGGLEISPSGEWIATGWAMNPPRLRHQDGGEPIELEHPDELEDIRFVFAGDEALITSQGGTHRWWLMSDSDQPQRTEEGRGHLWTVRGDEYFSVFVDEETCHLHRHPLEGEGSHAVGSMPCGNAAIDAGGSWLAFSRDNELYLRSLDDWDAPLRRIGRFNGETMGALDFHPDGSSVAAAEGSGAVRIWSTSADRSEPLWSAPWTGGVAGIRFDPTGDRLLVWGGGGDQGWQHLVWDLTAPQGTAPLTLRRTDGAEPNAAVFHPGGEWLITGDFTSFGFWPLAHSYPWVLDEESRVMDVDFSPDGKWLVSVSDVGPGGSFGQVRAWPLEGQNGGAYRVLLEKPPIFFYNADLTFEPGGERVAVSSRDGPIFLVLLAGGPPLELQGLSETGNRGYLVAFSPDGRFLAAVPNGFPEGEMIVRLWDLDSGEGRDIGRVTGLSIQLEFLDQSRLRWVGADFLEELGGERIFDLEEGSVQVLAEEGDPEHIRVSSPDGSFVVSLLWEDETSKLYRTDLESGEQHPIISHGTDVTGVAIDPSGRWMVTAGGDEWVRVGPVTGEEPTLLFARAGAFWKAAVSPDGNQIAVSGDGGLRLWPTPDLSKPPLHTLPHDELLAKLRSLTNLRAVRNDEDPTGWKVETGPFPGWAEVPEW